MILNQVVDLRFSIKFSFEIRICDTYFNIKYIFGNSLGLKLPLKYLLLMKKTIFDIKPFFL